MAVDADFGPDGRYRLLGRIGAGGMGEVFKAYDTRMGREVAIKVLRPEFAEQPGYRERFEREALTAGRLTDPHIIAIHDVGQSQGRLYLVMPLIDGVDVGSLLERDGAMSPSRAVGVVEQIAAALEAAHAAGLVHRDVKPSNALITGGEHVYLIDFGIVHDRAAPRLTDSGALVGSWAYLAPERIGKGIIDARADVYALACVLYECLTGERPFPAVSVEQYIYAHLHLEAPQTDRAESGSTGGF